MGKGKVTSFFFWGDGTVKKDVMVIDRSDPNEEVGYDPKKDKYFTRLDELKEGMHCRRDIAIVNTRRKCPTCGTEDGLFKQYAVYATESGEPTGDGWNLLTDEQKEQCRKNNRKLIKISKEIPEMEWYLAGHF